jgi:diguanylate cyclase (GGDEF)-like protein
MAGSVPDSRRALDRHAAPPASVPGYLRIAFPVFGLALLIATLFAVEPAMSAAVPSSHDGAFNPAAVAADRDAAIMFSAIYTGLILLALTGIAMFSVLRDRAYLHYTGYVVAMTLFVLAQNGHLVLVPGLAVLQSLHSLGLSLVTCLLAASMPGVARRLLGLAPTNPRVDAFLRWAPLLPLALAVVCATGWSALGHPLQVLSCAVLLAAVALCAFASVVAMVQRRHLAGPLLLMWLMLLTAGLIRLAVPYGLLPADDLTIYGVQIVGALSTFLLSIAMADRIIEFREQRDRARQAQTHADNNLRIEQERRKFVEALHMGLRRAADGDQDWMAYRRLLDALRPLMAQSSCAVVVYQDSEEDLLVSYPMESKDRYVALMAEREVAIRGICRSQLPMQMHIEQPAIEGGRIPETAAAEGSATVSATTASPAIDGQFAVLPLQLSLPAWGVLLVERPAGQVFSAEELQLAREFAEKATAASEEAANSLALRHSAEFDALTGAFNRRAVDLHLNKTFENARGRNIPMSILFVDLDRLKEINDVYGHAVGDRCLRLLAEALSSHCGPDDVFGRFGGDEFVAILSGAGPDRAKLWADKLLAATKQLGVECPEGFAQLGVSIGVASRMSSDREAQAMLGRADKALYAAKRLGRDRVESFEGMGTPMPTSGSSLHEA